MNHGLEPNPLPIPLDAILSTLTFHSRFSDSNVGENVQDHTYSSAAYELKDGHITLDSLRNNATFAQEQGALYAANQTSILSETVPSIAYISLSTLVGNETAAKLSSDLTAYAQSSKAPYKKTLTKQAEFLSKNPETISSMELIGIDGFFATNGAPEAGKNYVTFLAAQQHLASRVSLETNGDVTFIPPIFVSLTDPPFSPFFLIGFDPHQLFRSISLPYHRCRLLLSSLRRLCRHRRYWLPS